MKKLLLILMTLAMAAHAHPKMSDAKIKALLVGTWRADCGTRSTSTSTIEFKADGTVDYRTDNIPAEKWDIKDGMYREIPEAQERTYYYKILYLNKTAFLMLGVTSHAKGYFFYWRKPEDIPNDIYWSKDKDIQDIQDDDN
jgi:hypothetical protein